MQFITHSVSETHQIASKVLAKLQGLNVIALYGNLGSGKTTFVQGLAKSLKIHRRLISPTFVLMRSYPIPESNIFSHLHHIDLYRIDSTADLKSIDLEEIIASPKNLVIIEWAEKATTLPTHRMNLKFKVVGDNDREIDVQIN